MRRFASVGDIHEESENKKSEIIFKSVNVPTEGETTEVPIVSSTMLYQARPLDSELEEQADDEKSCEISPRKESTKDKVCNSFNFT